MALNGVLAEALDGLVEPLAELGRDAGLREAREQLLVVPRELAVTPPRRHVAPELVGPP
jgi:hypothetical protein